MIHSVRFTCVLDTNVIYPIDVRDLLLWFAFYELYTPKWSNQIFDEWIQLMKSKGVDQKEINQRVRSVNLAFPDAMVLNYESLIDGLTLPDEKDCHVLAAAIKTNANLIVTNNLKHFPTDYLAMFGLSARNADDFLTDTIDLNPEKAVEAFRKLVSIKKNPPLDEYEVLQRYRNIGLKETADFLHAYL
jgi:predicted nucleic acid-binding protein